MQEIEINKGHQHNRFYVKLYMVRHCSQLITQSQMRSLRKYAHILFIICVTVLAIRRISYITQLNYMYIKCAFFPRSNYSNSLTIYGHPSPRVHTSPSATPCRKGTSFACEWLLVTSVAIVLSLPIHQSRVLS